jgi:thiamine pyrophosphate-dependent acetolactate synthase large subunit-like protein
MDMLRLLDCEYAAILPGSTFRGIHDSAVNYLANRGPELIVCNHEMITVAVANGYYRATGKPMAAILHNFVGLINSSMTIYDAWCARAPVIILGGTGPLDARARRPWIDWIHTANVQGNAIRDFVKWDDQPASIAAIPESILRAYRIAMTEPYGPVYVNFDVTLQEGEIPKGFDLPDPAKFAPAASPAPDRGALREAARILIASEQPLVFADRVGRNADAVASLVELAELLAAPVINTGGAFSFPTPHPLDFTGAEKDLLRESDVVLGLDVLDLDGALRLPVNYLTRKAERASESQRVISISLDEMLARGLTSDYQALPSTDLSMLADTKLAIPYLLEEVQSLLGSNDRVRIDARRHAMIDRQEQLRAKQRDYVRAQWDHPEITEARLVSEIWEIIKSEDFVITHGGFLRMAPGVFSINGPAQHLGNLGAGAVGARPGVALGSALALKRTGKVPVAILGDGEFFGAIQTLWTAAHYSIPSLWVVNNNRLYYNDVGHQDRIARFRDRPPENKWIGLAIDDPAPDFSAIARTFGLHGEGPIRSAVDLGPALKRALEAVKRGQLAVIDVWTEGRAVA